MIKSTNNKNNKKDSSSGSESDFEYDSDSSVEYEFRTPAQRLREAIRSKQEDRKKGVYKEKENFDE